MCLISYPPETPKDIKRIFVKGINAQDNERKQQKILYATPYTDE